MKDSSEIKVIVAATQWTLNGVNVFSENLVKGLRERGIDARILLTEEDSSLVQVRDAPMKRPDIPFDRLPAGRWKTWGAHWGAMIRYLENLAPCIYIPNYDWRHSCVCPLLSPFVGVIGVVHSDDPLHYDHVSRLGKYWNVIAATSTTISQKTMASHPSLAGRVYTIPIGVDIPYEVPKRHTTSAGPLKLIYHGVLKQHQKRILDLPRIMNLAFERKLPVKLTIAGGGPDENQLIAASGNLIDKGLMEFVGVVPRHNMMKLLEEHDVYILTSEFEGMPNALLEAMGRGCVPLVTRMESAVPELVQDGQNGFVVAIGDMEAFVDRLEDLTRFGEQRLEMSRRAHATVSSGNFSVRDMVNSYANLIDRVAAQTKDGVFARPNGALNLPPAEVDGVSIFPVECFYEEKEIGKFHTIRDYREFREEIEQIRYPEHSPLAPVIFQPKKQIRSLADVNVIISSSVWTRTGVNEFSATLVRGLRAKNIAAHILLTEEATNLVNIPDKRMPRPDDIPFELLPVEKNESWGAHWGAMIRYLEERAPCVYIPNDDWRHSCTVPLLSGRVAVVGIVHGDLPLHYNHVSRLGRYWDCVVCTSDIVARKAKNLDATIADRITVISSDSESMVEDYEAIFCNIFDESHRCVYRRPEGVLNHAPAQLEGVGLFPVKLSWNVEGIGKFPSRRSDYGQFKRQIQKLMHADTTKLQNKPEIHPKLWNCLQRRSWIYERN